MSAQDKIIEFRIPISPTEGFFAQVRFFNYALRRLGPIYKAAKLTVVVGDHCDIDTVRVRNSWSVNDNVVWERVPDEVFDEFGIHGTANWRLALPARDAGLVILADADTVLLRDLDPLIGTFPTTVAAVRGHMAHFPPPFLSNKPQFAGDSVDWERLFQIFGAVWPVPTYRYSMDKGEEFPPAPAYFNLGFVVLNQAAHQIIGRQILEFDRAFLRTFSSFMRCQIALSILAHRSEIDIKPLSAIYNTANDPLHMALHGVSANDIRVLHYLRLDEIDRSSIFTEDGIKFFLSRQLRNPANRALQALAREYQRAKE